MLAQHPAISMDKLTRFGGIRAQLTQQRILAPGRHKTDILAVRLFRHREAKARRILLSMLA
jgi:hypothetical protein